MADILTEEQDCFEERPDGGEYVFPDKEVTFSLGQNKREIFKMSRNMTRMKL